MTDSVFDEDNKVRRVEAEGGTKNPYVSIRKSGSIGISKGGRTIANLDEKERILLYYSDEENVLGLKPLEDVDEEEEKHSFKIQLADVKEGGEVKSRGGASITPTRFLKYHNLIPEETTRYPARWREEEGGFVVDLDEPIDD